MSFVRAARSSLARIATATRPVASRVRDDRGDRDSEPVIDHGAIGRVLARRLVGRQGRIGVHVPPNPPRVLRAIEVHRRRRHTRAHLPHRRDVVQDPERPAVRADDEVIVLDDQIADRCSRLFRRRLCNSSPSSNDTYTASSVRKDTPARGPSADRVYNGASELGGDVVQSFRQRASGRCAGAGTANVFTAAYAAEVECDASISDTLERVSCGGRPYAHVAAQSRVTCMVRRRCHPSS